MDVTAGSTDREIQYASGLAAWDAGGLRERALTARPTDGPIYGPPLLPGPLAYAPVNEMGVVFLFGWMAPHLGYVVHRLQSEFPDCEQCAGGRRQVRAGRS